MTRSIATHGVAEAQIWTPKLLGSTTLAIWIDASDGATFTYSSGDVVSQWNDKSGNSRHFAQATTSRQPTRVTNVQNGLAVVRTSSSMLTTSSAGVSTPFHYALAFKGQAQPANTTWKRILGDQTTAYKGMLDIDRSTTGGTGLYAIYSDPNGVFRGTPETAWTLLLGTYNGANSLIRINGAQSGTIGTVGSGTPTGLVLGALNNYTQFFNSDYGELLVLSGTLASGDRDKVEGYLAWKWGLQANLPSTHPYKNYRP